MKAGVHVVNQQLRMTFTQNEKKKSTDDNEKPSIVCYRPLIVVLFLTFRKVGQ